MLCYCALFKMSVSQIIVIQGRMISEQQIGKIHRREHLWPNWGIFMELPWRKWRKARNPQDCSCPLLDLKFATSDATWATTPVKPSYYACCKAVEDCSVIKHHVILNTCIPFSGTLYLVCSLKLVLWKMTLMGVVIVAQRQCLLRQISKFIPCWFYFLNYLFPSTFEIPMNLLFSLS